MATLAPDNILTTEAAARSASSAALRTLSYTRRTSGTRDLALAEPTSVVTGYWQTPTNISSKPPRWIVQIDTGAIPPRVDLARDPAGALLPGAATLGYVNNGGGKCALTAFRLMPALKVAGSPFAFPPEWEWIVQLAFAKPLPEVTSGDALTDFNASASEIEYKGRAATKSKVLALE